MILSVTGTGNKEAGEPVRFYLEKSDGGQILPIPANSSQWRSPTTGNYYYQLGACTSQNFQPCGVSYVSYTLPVGDYRTHCDLPTDPPPIKCSGNPFCSSPLGSGGENCNGWIRCSGSDRAFFSIVAPGLTPTPTSIPATCSAPMVPTVEVLNNKTYENKLDFRVTFGRDDQLQYQTYIKDGQCLGSWGAGVKNEDCSLGRGRVVKQETVNTNDSDKCLTVRARGKNLAGGLICSQCQLNDSNTCCISDWSQTKRCSFCRHPTSVTTSKTVCNPGQPDEYFGTRITWADQSEVEDGFVIYRCDTGICPSDTSNYIATLGRDTNSFRDCDYEYGTKSYAVRCYTDDCAPIRKLTPTPTPTPVSSCSSAVLSPSVFTFNKNKTQAVIVSGLVGANLTTDVDHVSFRSSNSSITSVNPSTDFSYPFSTTVKGEKVGGPITITADVYLKPDDGVADCFGTARVTVSTEDPWFQTQEGDVHSQRNIRSSIPRTALEPFFSLKGATGYPGVVSYNGSTKPDFGAGEVSSKKWLAKTSLSVPYRYS
ncbi:hypothetical protein COU95_03050, partial [Candidatus Shapirobacteria bacterium CG10_big_fil_rev_8_21_14_0_10_40_9]